VAFPFDHVAFEPAYVSVLNNPMATLLIVGLDEHIVGYLLGYRHSTFWAGADVWWVEELFVDIDHRGRGAGQSLMNYFEERAQQAGARLVCLITRKAAEFYRAIGYEELAVYLRKVL
jgi:GNAT superfamily N-acetyltransferase